MFHQLLIGMGVSDPAMPASLLVVELRVLAIESLQVDTLTPGYMMSFLEVSTAGACELSTTGRIQKGEKPLIVPE